MNKGWKFLKKLWCCVGGGNKVIWLYQLNWKCKLATVTIYKAQVSSVSPSSEPSSERRANILARAHGGVGYLQPRGRVLAASCIAWFSDGPSSLASTPSVGERKESRRANSDRLRIRLHLAAFEDLTSKSSRLFRRLQASPSSSSITGGPSARWVEIIKM